MSNYELERKKIENELRIKLNKIKQNSIKEAEQVKRQAQIKLAKIEKDKKGNKQSNKEQVIPIFFASDANYLPYLSVSLASLKDNRNKNFIYKIYILHSGITEAEQKPILSFGEDKFMVMFVNVSEKLEEVKKELQVRDYYTGATYYRVFIANMFPEYNKALYLDSDTVILGDISKLYNFDLKNNLVGGVTDKVVASHPVFQEYCRAVLGIEPRNYFNAGILLMNLKQIRKENFYQKFCSLLKEYKFVVAQDQDYLNVICKDKVKYLPYSWNTMPIGGENKMLPQLVHYNLTLKPWHYADIPYAKHFWKYAQQSYYSDSIRASFGGHTLEKKLKDDETEANLIMLAKEEINKEDNFIKSRNKAFSVSDYLVEEEVFEFGEADLQIGVNN